MIDKNTECPALTNTTMDAFFNCQTMNHTLLYRISSYLVT